MSAERPLGAAHATALVVANMVGTGVFTTTGIVLPQLGSPWAVLGVWAVSGLLALCGAAVYAELGAMMPRAGGEYVYLSRGLHPAAGFLGGWVALLVGFAAPTAAAALAFGRYLHAALPGVGPTLAALALIAALTVAHMTNVAFGARLQTAVTALVVALIVVFVVGAAASGRGDWAHLAASATPGKAVGPAGLALGLVYVGYAYFGWNAVSYMAGEVRDPSRTLPLALAVGTGTVTVLYLALNLVFLWAVPPGVLAGKIEVAHVAATALFGARGAVWLSILVALAVAGCASAMLMAGPRITLAMAEDGVFFAALRQRNGRGAPSAAVALQGGIAAVAALTAGFDRLLVFVGFTLNLTAGAAVVAAFVLRHRHPDADRPHRALGWPVSGLLFLALIAVMSFFAVRERPWESAAGLATLVSGGGVYIVWQRRLRGPAAGPPTIPSDPGRPGGGSTRVLP